MAVEKLKYFFSYSRKDSEFVLQLAKELRAVGANVWLDQLDILGGELWDDTVEKTLKSCKGVIAVLSPESVVSSNVMDEVSYALDNGKLVVPVLIGSCDIPFRLRRLQYIDFTADYDTGFTRLLRALGIEQPGQPLESAATQEPVAEDSTAPVEEKPTEPLVHEEHAAQEVEEPLLSEVSEPIPDERDQPKPTGLETEKAGSKRRMAKVLAAICIVTLITIISIVLFLIYRQPKTYTLTTTAVDGSATKEPNKPSYKHREKVILTAVPNPGYIFESWSGALSDSNNPAELVMDADKSVTANFVKTYTLRVTVKTDSLTATAVDGSVTKEPNKPSYKHREKVILTAVPNPGYIFESWSGALSDSNNPAELVMNADMSVTASFALKTYRLDILHAVGGSVTKSPDQASYKHGETVMLEAVPNTESGYSFTNWSGDLSDSNNPAELVMDADMSVTASFALKTYRLDILHAVGGSVTKSPDQASYKHGEAVMLEAVPNTESGYSFTNWSGDLSDSNNPAELVMDADMSVTASFALKTYRLDILHAVGGSVTKSPDQASYKHGETVIFEAVPNTESGYSFTNWSGDLSGSTNPTTLVMDADMSVTASFDRKNNSRSDDDNGGGCSPSPHHRGSVSEYMLPYLLLLGVWIMAKRKDSCHRNDANKRDKPA